MFSEELYKEVADELGCEVATIKAIARVESKERCFTQNGRVMCLFEAHVFYRQTKGAFAKSHPTLCYRNFDKEKKHYKKSYDEEYTQRFSVAFNLNPTAAIESTSWGAFQIMGFHWKALGFESAGKMLDYMKDNPENHLRLFAKFIKGKSVLWNALVTKNWLKVAYHYNGVSYQINQYDKKLAAAYEKYNV